MARGRRGTGKPRVSVSYEYASDDVKGLAGKIISNNSYHGFLAQAKIAYLWRHGKWSKAGKTVYVSIEKCNAKNKHLHGFDYLVIINAEFWWILKSEQREAALDEQLCYACLDAKTERFSLQGPDVVANTQNIRRYGTWRIEVAQLVKAVAEGVHPGQTELPVNEEPPRAEEETTPAADDQQAPEPLVLGGEDTGDQGEEAPAPPTNVRPLRRRNKGAKNAAAELEEAPF